MADVAFLLLIFFLATTTIAEEFGLSLILPAKSQRNDRIEVNRDNVMVITTDVTGVRAPNGAGQLSCHWEEYSPAGTFDKAVNFKGFNCFLNFGGFSTTNQSHFTLARSGVANMKCTFPPA